MKSFIVNFDLPIGNRGLQFSTQKEFVDFTQQLSLVIPLVAGDRYHTVNCSDFTRDETRRLCMYFIDSEYQSNINELDQALAS